MKKRLINISPLQQGIVLGALYGVLALIAVPFIIIIGLARGSGFGVFAAIFLPVVYAVIGFVAGALTAVVYNLVAKWTGGIEFTLIDV